MPAWILAGLVIGGVPAATSAQVAPPGMPVSPSAGGSVLIQNPQAGATPRLAPPSPELSLPVQPSAPPIAPPSTPSLTGPFLQAPRALHGSLAPDGHAAAVPHDGLWAAVPGGLPVPSDDPMRIDPATDPVLQLARVEAPAAGFRDAIAAAIRQAPGLDEVIAQREEAQGVRNEAVSRATPVADLSLSSFKIIRRAFSNDPGNILERQRPDRRTDGTLHVQMPFYEFGATHQRVLAGDDRLQAAAAQIEDTGSQLALRAIGAWYNVYGYRALVRLGEAFALTQRDLHFRVEERVVQGASASGDVAQVDSYIAASDAQLADFRRSLANAEAQYSAFFGAAAPAALTRAPVPDLRGIAAAGLADDTAKLPAVRAARLGVAAATRDVKAINADRLPQLNGAVDAGRYGVIETGRDYDVRGTVTVSLRLGGGAAQRVEQARARADGADARYRRTQQEAARDAAIALSDVGALEDARAAIEGNYIASRRSRDVLAQRFLVSRGTLLDLLGAETNYFSVAARYVQTVIELDTARYALLARTGRMLSALGIDPSTLDPRARLDRR